MVNFLELTKKYYSQWLDIDIDQMDKKGIVLIRTDKRKRCPKGYPKNLEVYAIANNSSLFISFSPDIDEEVNISKIFSKLTSVDAGVAKLKELFGERLYHRKTYYFSKLPDDIDTSEVICMKKENYADYLSFFMKQHPNASPEGWLEKYFTKISEGKRCYGIYKDNILVSVTDAPDIPFMEGIITEPGVNTLAEYRGKGYAKAVCAKYLENAISRNEVPIWTCLHNNIASCKLAEKLGYKWFADLYTVQ